MPPTPDECAAFLADFRRSPDAIEKVVDNLLARPAYGERWARHWLDLVRYAESNGYERDATKPFAWRDRDYVIRSFNSDKPFDRFVLEQIAGDELPEDDRTPENLIATGYFASAPGTTSQPTRNKIATISSTISSLQPRRSSSA